MKNYLIFTLFYLSSFLAFAENILIEECAPLYEINPPWQTIRLRSHENAFLNCTVTQEKFNELIAAAFTDPEIDKTEFKSLFIGRLVEYPWLSQYLAKHVLQHPDWDPEQGTYTGDNINAFVAGILSESALLKQIQQPLDGTGYIVTGASVEKVLIGRANEIEWLDINATVLVPYDVMLHFIMEQQDLPSNSME